MKIVRLIFLFLLTFSVFSCAYSSKTKGGKVKIKDYLISLPNEANVCYESFDSASGKIVFIRDGFVAYFATGYIDTLLPIHLLNATFKRDTIGKYILRTVIIADSNEKRSVDFSAWNTSDSTSLIMDETRYNGIIISASKLRPKNEK
jgi:hypothetical protein